MPPTDGWAVKWLLNGGLLPPFIRLYVLLSRGRQARPSKKRKILYALGKMKRKGYVDVVVVVGGSSSTTNVSVFNL